MSDRLFIINIFIVALILFSNSVLYAKKVVSYDTYEYQFDPETQKLLLTIISIDLKDIPLEEALKVLASKANLKLNYNRHRIPVDKIVSVKMNNVPAIKALLKILNETGTGLKVTEQGLLAIVPSKENYGEIRGTVVEGKSGEALAGANVVIVDETLGAATDLKGRFVIAKLPAGVYSLEASMMGYGSNKLIILLLPQMPLLNYILN